MLEIKIKKNNMVFLDNIKQDMRSFEQKKLPLWEIFARILMKPGVQALLLYRLARFFYKKKLKVFSLIIWRFSFFLTNADIHYKAQLGKGIIFPHTSGIVIGHDAIVGDNCIIFQQVTIGSLKPGKIEMPVIGSNVHIGCGAKVLGGIKIGDNARIGANAVVIKDVEKNVTVIGVHA